MKPTVVDFIATGMGMVFIVLFVMIFATMTLPQFGTDMWCAIAMTVLEIAGIAITAWFIYDLWSDYI